MAEDVQGDVSTTARSSVIVMAVSGVLAALVCVATMIIQIPNPPTRGYINVGDAVIFVGALTFGGVVGGISGGLGSALADIFSGYGYFAPFTLVIKGIEGVLAGVVSDGRSVKRDALGVLIGGFTMICGYFLCEAFVMGYGVAPALTEVPGNVFQIAVGALIGIPSSLAIRRQLPSIVNRIRL